MARRRVEIKKIEDRSKRQITFTKRRQGLFKKAGELCTKCDAQIAVIAFSMAGNAYGFGDPSVQSVVNRYLTTTTVPAAPPSLSRNNAAAADSERLKAEKKVVETLGKVIDGGGSRLWDEEIAELGFDELEQLRISIEDIKKMIVQQESNERGSPVI